MIKNVENSLTDAQRFELETNGLETDIVNECLSAVLIPNFDVRMLQQESIEADPRT